MPRELLLERNAARDAPSSREFRLLYNAAFATDSFTRQIEDRFLCFATGRLGLRSGELLHFLHGDEADWLDRERKVIHVPHHAPCDCRYCRDRAADVAARREDVSTEDVLELYWQPKYEASVRAIPYGWSAEAIDTVERFADETGGFTVAQSTVNRRLATLQDHAGLQGKLYPHALRAAAAFFWANEGLEAHYLQALLGWQDMRVANRYIRATGEQLNQRVLDVIDDADGRHVPGELPDPTEAIYDRTGRANQNDTETATTLWDWAES